EEARALRRAADAMEGGKPDDAVAVALSDDLAGRMVSADPRGEAVRHETDLTVFVDPVRARFSSWYEMFPRSCAPEAGRHGTFRDAEAMLPYVSELGFDVLYLPPVHPVGTSFRKGKNNSVECAPGEPGSPWAIGSKEGGHKAVHPELGTLGDFRSLVKAAKKAGIDVAIDIAFQVSPDHPYAKEHPEWFRRRPDGTIQYAENPPKKYQDIYPFEFDSEAWPALWEELRSVFEFWIGQGVRIFRVDNPHTKPFRFWEWCLGSLKEEHPDLIFLSEAFTRPKVMYRLAKAGFTQSYTYFPWRNEKTEIERYFTELTRPPVAEFFRGNHWPNTPDILTAFLQNGGRPAFAARLVLAATLAASYGIYGPAFELCESRPLHEGSEEYLDSEKYEIRAWNREDPGSLRGLVARVNRARRENPALHHDRNLVFHPTDSDAILCYSKATPGKDNVILSVVNLDPHHTRSGWVTLALGELGLDPEAPFQVHDLLSDARYEWRGPVNYVELNPQVLPAHVFHVRRRIRTEKDFDYFG
ncbi:MAG TPA: alpha-amylase family glycosyl hydrolase, partial [Candidatus Saccharimonadales bacterium]|nr:alpha-amylase family glycosyl hydrolase [Candidatus Saccharimonadales bacterium]